MSQLNAKELYNKGTDYQFENQEIKLGPWTSFSMQTDPKHMSFVLARYKFVSKMLEDKKSILEVGCGDGFGLPITAQGKQKYYAADWDERLLDNIKGRLGFLENIECRHIDFNITTASDIKVDAIFNIDVIEHLEPNNEKNFMENMIKCFSDKQSGIMVVGTPNITALPYASEQSKVQHCNLKSVESLRAMMQEYFYNVLMFGMNDEVIHTGYAPMCHYIWAIGCGVRG